MRNTQSTLGCKFYIIRILTTMRIFNKEKCTRLFTLTLLMIKGLVMVNTANSSPYFGVDIDLHNVGVDIRVNDIPTYFDYTKGQLTVEIPVPESIIDGLNKLSLSAFLPINTKEYEDGAYATATLFQQDLSSEASNKVKLLSVMLRMNGGKVFAEIEDYANNQKSSPTVSLSKNKSVSIELSTTIKSPFPKWVWQDGLPIKNNQTNFNSLMNTYKEIHSTLKIKNIKKLERHYAMRAKEIAIAYNLTGENEGLKKLSVGKDMMDQSLELYDLRIDDMNLEVLANGKLARIRDDQFNAQPIFYYDNKADLLHIYKFMFYLNKDNQWIMIR